MTSIAPCLWFDRNAEEAANFYASLFPDSRVDHVQRSPADYPNGKAGDPILVQFTLCGRPFQGLNGGPNVPFTQAVSFAIDCKDQAEVDRYWEALTADGGEPVACGWCKDRFGLSWQVVPKRMIELLADADPGRARRAMEAMMGMTKLDVAALDRAADGEA
jgi:predicted 3-demethylubiquinone-9 3-methyltransferase (glyoxalase superfamily)